MMLNPMAAGRPEPQWTKYEPGNIFEDCEWRVEEIEILGVKQKYIMIRGTALFAGTVSINMPAGVKPHYPSRGFAITCYEANGDLIFGTSSVTVYNSANNAISFTTYNKNSRFLIFARVR